MATQNVFQVNTPEDNTGYVCWKTNLAWQRCIKEALQPFGVPIAQFVTMMALLWLMTHNAMPNQSEIIRLTGLDKMTLSKTLKKMRAEKLVKSMEDQLDTRAKVAMLTPKGIKLTEQVIKVTREIDKKFFSNLSLEEQMQLKKLLLKVSSSHDA